MTDILIFVAYFILGMAFCQSVAFMIWHLLHFISDFSDTKRFLISLLFSFTFYITAISSTDFLFLILVTIFFMTIEVTYATQSYTLQKYPHWSRDAVLYLSLCFGLTTSLLFAIFFFQSFALL